MASHSRASSMVLADPFVGFAAEWRNRLGGHRIVAAEIPQPAEHSPAGLLTVFPGCVRRHYALYLHPASMAAPRKGPALEIRLRPDSADLSWQPGAPCIFGSLP